MESFLGSIRNASFVLILVSAAVLLFAFSPNDYSALKEAYNEAVALRMLDESHLLNFYESHTASILEEQDMVALKSLLQKAFARLSLWNTTRMRVNTPVLVPALPSHTLQSFYNFFERVHSRWGIFLPAINWHPLLVLVAEPPDTDLTDKWAANLTEAIYRSRCFDDIAHRNVPCKTISSAASVNDFVFRVAHRDAIKARVPGWGENFIRNGISYGAVYQDVNDESWDEGQLYVVWSLGRRRWYFQAPMEPIPDIEAGVPPSPAIWLHEFRPPTLDLGQLRDALAGGRGNVAFPGLQEQDWDIISRESPAEAAEYFHQRLSSTPKASVGLYGLTVDERLVLMAAPAAILLASLYMLSLLRIFRTSLTRSRLPDSSLKSYPWFGLFTDPLSMAGSFAFIVALPPLSSSLLIYRYSPRFNGSTLAAVAETLLLITVSIFTGFELAKLRDRFGSAVLPAESSDGDS